MSKAVNIVNIYIYSQYKPYPYILNRTHRTEDIPPHSSHMIMEAQQFILLPAPCLVGSAADSLRFVKEESWEFLQAQSQGVWTWKG